MRQIKNGIIYGLSYFTTLPFIVDDFKVDNSFYKGVLYSLPIAGFILSFITIVVYISLPFNNIYSAFISAILYIFLYGMLHLEAVGDTIDGYYASLSFKDIYEVMHEPQLGALGTVGVFCFTLLKIASIVYVLYLGQYIILVLSLVLSRISIWFVLDLEFHKKSTFINSLKQSYIKNIVVDLILLPLKISTRYIAKKIKLQLGFLNGDILGFIIVLNEILLLNIFLIIYFILKT